MLTENNISRDVNMLSVKVEAFISTMRWIVTNEDAFVESEVQFMLVARPEMRPTSTTKNL